MVGALIAAATIVPGPALASSRTPKVPRLPRNFRATGRYVVADLGVNVPFTWEGRDGDSQMVAGGPNYPIWFTNLIYHDTLYTLTYWWPNLAPNQPCGKIPGFSLGTLNQLLSTSHFVGREILQGKPPRYVNHGE